MLSFLLDKVTHEITCVMGRLKHTSASIAVLPNTAAVNHTWLFKSKLN